MTAHVRFVHAADVHLDAPFKGVRATDPTVRDALLTSTYEAFERVVQLCVDEAVDFLVIAGDLYNSRDKSLRAQLAFRDGCVRLAEAGIEVFVARGNHDPADGWSAGLTLPDTVHFFPSDQVGRFEFGRDGEHVCAVYGRSFPKANVKENLVRGFRREPSDALAIAVLHANVGGREGHEAYSPCSTDDLRDAGFDYWALGHIHRAETVLDDPPAEYPGSTQGLTPRETGIHGCLLVELDARGATRTPVATHSITWDHAVVEIESLETIDDLRGELDTACGEARDAADGRPVIVRIRLQGRGPLHHAVAHDEHLDDLLEDVRADQMSRTPWLWVERIRDRTSPEVDLEAIRDGQDLAADLVHIVDDLVDDDVAAGGVLADAVASLSGKTDSLADADPRLVLEAARDILLDRFGAEAER